MLWKFFPEKSLGRSGRAMARYRRVGFFFSIKTVFFEISFRVQAIFVNENNVFLRLGRFSSMKTMFF